MSIFSPNKSLSEIFASNNLIKDISRCHRFPHFSYRPKFQHLKITSVCKFSAKKTFMIYYDLKIYRAPYLRWCSCKCSITFQAILNKPRSTSRFINPSLPMSRNWSNEIIMPGSDLTWFNTRITRVVCANFSLSTSSVNVLPNDAADK